MRPLKLTVQSKEMVENVKKIAMDYQINEGSVMKWFEICFFLYGS